MIYLLGAIVEILLNLIIVMLCKGRKKETDNNHVTLVIKKQTMKSYVFVLISAG
jgi:hypothetical protein